MANDTSPWEYLVGIPPALRVPDRGNIRYRCQWHNSCLCQGSATKKEQRITITAPHKLSRDEINSKIRDAEKFAADDLKRKEEIEVTNAADSLVYASEKMLKESGDVATSEQKEKIEKGISDLKNAQTGGDISEIKTKTESLQSAIYELSAAMYQKAAQEQQAQADQSAGQETGQGSGDQDQTVDADYEVVDEE